MSDIAARVKKIIVDKLGVDEAEVTNEASFTNDLGADSLDTVELIMEFEKEFNISIPDEQAETITTVAGCFVPGRTCQIINLIVSRNCGKYNNPPSVCTRIVEGGFILRKIVPQAYAIKTSCNNRNGCRYAAWKFNYRVLE